MRVGLISNGQHTLTACELLATGLQAAGAHVTLLTPTTPRNITINWIAMTPQQAASSILLYDFDAVGIFTEAPEAAELRRIQQHSASFRQRETPILFSGPTQLLCGDALSADLLPRLGFDLLCLPGKIHQDHLEWLLQDGAVAKQAHTNIGLWFLQTAPIGVSRSQEHLLVVLDQPHIPPSPAANAVLYSRLCMAARESPDWQIRLQPDTALPNNPDQWPSTSLAWHHRQDKQTPDNLQLGAPEDLIWSLTQASACLGISSEWLIPPITWGKPAVALADYGIRTDFNSSLFFGSGIMHRLSDCVPLERLLTLAAPNSNWLDELGWSIPDGPRQLLKQLRKLQRPHESAPTSPTEKHR